MTSPHARARTSLAVALLMVWTGFAQAQTESPPGSRLSISALRVGEPPVIDGTLDDEAWADAQPIGDFTQVNPVNGAAPTERTEVRLLYDDDHIYIGVRCFDTEPDKIIARSMGRDAGFGSDDRITLTLDTFNDRRNGYIFTVSAAGGKLDGLIESTRTRFEWDGLWDAKTSIDDEGWSAEISIPTKTLSFDPDATTWGFNVERIIRRKNESARWSNASRDSDVDRMNDAGAIEDLVDLKQGYGLTFKPFLTTRVDIDDNDVTFEPGADLFYKLTPSSTLALTLNTDFAEAEVDRREVNLTRFPTFFPEKRAFFLEDSGVFEFGGINQSPRPFFSRRIGIVGGEQKDILAGLRLTGRTGDLRFGALNVQMKDDDELGAKNLSVLRLTHDVGDESALGVIATNGAPGNRGENQLVGADFNYVNSDALGGSVAASLWAMGTHDDPDYPDDPDAEAAAENDTPYAYGGRFSWDADPWSAFLFYAEVGRDFQPRMGFVSRRDRREYASRFQYTWRDEDNSYIRSVSARVSAGGYTTMGNQIESADADLPRLTVTSRDGDQVYVVGLYEQERLTDTFEIVDDVFIPVGKYENAGWRAGFRTSSSRWISMESNYSERGFYDGDRKDTYVEVTFRPNASLYLSGEYFMNDIDLSGGSFIVRTARTNATVQFSPELSWTNSLQWDNQSDQAGLNSRIRYEFRPGQEIFVVYNEGFDVQDDEFESLDSELTLKLGLTFRF